MNKSIIIILFSVFTLLQACSKEGKEAEVPFITFKTGSEYVQSGKAYATGAPMKFGIQSTGISEPITNLVVEVIVDGEKTTMLDWGTYFMEMDSTFVFYKGEAEEEIWMFRVMDMNRKFAEITSTVVKGAGSGYGEINAYDSIVMGFQSNPEYGHFLDPYTGSVYDHPTVSGHEGAIEMLTYYYVTSGLPSPTFACPERLDTHDYYPEVGSWTIKNSTMYDYKTADNYLVTEEEFDAAGNDSLLIYAFNTSAISGKCKYSTDGKVIPFRTSTGKFGMIRIIEAIHTNDGTVMFDLKIQK